MMGTTHAAFALLCYYVIAYFAGLPFDTLMVLTLLIIGSLLPDIDHPRGFLARQSYLFRRTSKGISKFVTHRGIVHSLLAALIATAIVWVIAMFYRWEALAVACFFLGFISHLAADSLNPTGIKWLQPFSKAKVKDGIRTGSATEKFLFLIILIAISAIVYTVHPELFSILSEHVLPET
jgi:inner membrane protein